MAQQHPANYIDLTGQRFGLLTVLEFVGNDNFGCSKWKCLCDCGNISIVRSHDLRTGNTKSCGCLMHTPAYNRTHNESKTKLFRRWSDMINRCQNPNNNSYEYYGGRGITVCDEWNDFITFRDWAYDNGYQDGLSIDRIDVNGNYEPNNCRWATNLEQANNKRSNFMITYFDETHSLSDWCRILNLPYSVIYSRIHVYNYDFWTAISTPLPDHYYEDCYDYDYSNEYYEDPYEYDNYMYDE